MPATLSVATTLGKLISVLTGSNLIMMNATESGLTGRLDYWATCACCSPAALRETPPAPPVTLLRYPAVNMWKLQPPPPSLRLPQLQSKVSGLHVKLNSLNTNLTLLTPSKCLTHKE